LLSEGESGFKFDTLGNYIKQSMVCSQSFCHFEQDHDARKEKSGLRKKIKNPKQKSNVLDPALQKALWTLPHGSIEHVPGKLSICVGMPIMLHHNEATECCITKGAEGTVECWQASIGPHNMPMLDTLFIKLSNPPKTVQIEGLPDNVVPITRQSTKITCKLWNDDVVTINRN